MGGIFASSNAGQAAPTVLRNDVAVELRLGREQSRLRQSRDHPRTPGRARAATDRDVPRAGHRRRRDRAAATPSSKPPPSASPKPRSACKQAQESYTGNLKGLSETTRFGDMLTLVNRPQEVVAALQQLATAYDNYFSTVNEYNRGPIPPLPRPRLSLRHSRLRANPRHRPARRHPPPAPVPPVNAPSGGYGGH